MRRLETDLIEEIDVLPYANSELSPEKTLKKTVDKSRKKWYYTRKKRYKRRWYI